MTKLLAKCRKLPQAASEIWEGGRVKARFWVMDKQDQPIRAILEIWAEKRTEVIIKFEMTPAMPSRQQSLKLLLTAMLNPMVGPPHRPERIRVAEKAFADFIAPVLAGLNIAVEHVDRCKLIESLAEMLAENFGYSPKEQSLPCLLHIPGMTAARAEAFYKTADAFYRAAPWQYITDEHYLEISSSGFAQSPWYVIVLGNAGLEFGMSLHESLEAYKAYYNAAVTGSLKQAGVCAVSLAFSTPDYLSFDDLDAIDAHNWPIANPNAYPHAFVFESGVEPCVRSPSSTQLEVIEACMDALPAFLKKNRAAARAGNPVSEKRRVETAHKSYELEIVWHPSDE